MAHKHHPKEARIVAEQAVKLRIMEIALQKKR